MESKKVPTVVFILGGPGAGKGTQCALLVDKHQFIHLSTGDLLREEVANKGPNAAEIAKIQAEGGLVSSEILVKIIKGRLEKNPEGKFLLDGFPRNQENIDVWNKIIGDAAEIPCLLYFDCSDETMKNRILGRSKTSGRTDDNEKAIVKRLKTFRDYTIPIVELKAKEGKLKTISAEETREVVFEETKKILIDLKLIKEEKNLK